MLDLIQPIQNKIYHLFLGKRLILPKNNPIKSVSLASKIEDYLDEHIVFGGYPVVVLTKNNQIKQQLLANILDTYLLRDIKSLLKLATDDKLISLARLLSLQVGNLVVFQELSSSARLPFVELQKHIKILSETYLIELIKPFYHNKRTELVKNPKCYFLDLGFRNILLNDFTPLGLRIDRGGLFENYVFLALKKQLKFFSIKYWRTKAQAEVDFILEQNQKIIPVEAKYQADNSLTLGKSYHSFIKKYRPKIGIVVTLSAWKQVKIDQTLVYFIPAYYL